MHPLPELLSRKEVFEADEYMFSVRVAAYHWSKLSSDMRAGLAGIVGVDSTQLEDRVREEGFAVKMYDD